MALTDQISRMIHKSRAYKRLFKEANPVNTESFDSLAVLKDLRKFCNVDASTVRVSSTGNIDALAMAVAEGRREVWLRIQAQLNLSEIDLEKIKEYQDD